MSALTAFPRLLKAYSLFFGITILAACSAKTPLDPSPTVPNPSPTIAASPTSSITTTLTPTQPIFQLNTPVGENLIDQVNYLLETNGDCAYPCWWGIHPGSTALSDANGYLVPLSFSLEDRGISSESSDLHLVFGDFLYPPAANGFLRKVYDVIFYVQQSTERIVMIQTFIDMDLATFLESIGIPDDVFLTVQTYDIGTTPMYYTLSLYYEDGFLISIWDEYEFDPENNILICPQSGKRRDLDAFFWDPIYLHGFGNLLPFARPGATPDNEFLPLADISGMSLESLFRLMVDPSADQCIRIPSDVFFPH